MTSTQLRRLQAAARSATNATQKRNEVIAEIHAEGVGLREIARALGMTHPGIKKIIERTNP